MATFEITGLERQDDKTGRIALQCRKQFGPYSGQLFLFVPLGELWRFTIGAKFTLNLEPIVGEGILSDLEVGKQLQQ